MRVAVEDISPDQAVDMLARNEENRVIRKERVRTLARAIERGEWVPNGETVKVSTTGQLLDGQHRLAACVEAGTAIRTVVVRDLEPGTQETVDFGARRTPADVFRARGVQEATTISAASRIAMTYETGRGSPSITVQELLHYVEGVGPELVEFAATRSKEMTAGLPGIPRTVHGAALLLFGRANLQDASRFASEVASGEDLPPGSPTLALRTRIIAGMARREKMNQRFCLAIEIKAWNALRSGDRVKNLRWSPSEGMPPVAGWPGELPYGQQLAFGAGKH
jgi:hypothetical protein